MRTKLPASFLPAKFQVLSGSALKLIAITLMLIDHTGLMILYNYPATTATLFSFGGVDYSWYRIFRDIGRAAFPIFCFLLVEGFLHTHNRKKYGLNLFLFACISEIPWNFMFTNTWRYEKQNVFFTLFLGYLAFCALEYFWDNQKMQLVCVLALLTVSVFLKADYGWRGFVFLLIMYWFRNDKTAQAIIGSCWLYYEWKACFAFLSINMYNGERGFVKGKFLKYVFATYLESSTVMRLDKFGRAVHASYEAVRRQRLDAFGAVLRSIGVKLGNVILGPAILKRNAEAGSTVDVKTSGTLTYADMITLYGAFRDFDMTAVLASPKLAAQIMTMDQMKEMASAQPSRILLPFGAQLLKCGGMSDDYLIGLDQKFALEMVTGSDLILETDKLIDSQLDTIAMSIRVGFRVMTADAVHVLAM